MSDYQRVIAICLLGLTSILSGCGYGKVEVVTYEYAKALYLICNQKDEQRLAEFKQTIIELKENQEMSEKESEWLLDIVADAEEGEWESSMLTCRQMMEDQVNR